MHVNLEPSKLHQPSHISEMIMPYLTHGERNLAYVRRITFQLPKIYTRQHGGTGTIGGDWKYVCNRIERRFVRHLEYGSSDIHVDARTPVSSP